jgi:hypothetical protein
MVSELMGNELMGGNANRSIIKKPVANERPDSLWMEYCIL